ncbi:MAG: hypothetical protein WKF82_10860 [Nocardioidaceae bacterium]
MSGTAYDRLIVALVAVVKVSHNRDGSARAQCPGHQSRGLSLLVSRRDDGAGVYCFAGCETVDVLAAVGLGMRDLFDDSGDDWKRPAGWAPRPPPNPLGDPEHRCDRAEQQTRLDADPAWVARRATELAAATEARPGDFEGAGRG